MIPLWPWHAVTLLLLAAAPQSRMRRKQLALALVPNPQLAGRNIVENPWWSGHMSSFEWQGLSFHIHFATSLQTLWQRLFLVGPISLSHADFFLALIMHWFAWVGVSYQTGNMEQHRTTQKSWMSACIFFCTWHVEWHAAVVLLYRVLPASQSIW